MRGAPKSGFSILIRRIGARNFLALPVGATSSPNTPESRIDANGTSVSGRMIVRTCRIDGNQPYSWMKNQRSLFVSWDRPRILRRND